MQERGQHGHMPTSLRTTTARLLVAGAMAAGGACSSSSPSTVKSISTTSPDSRPATSLPDPCSWISSEQASDVVGVDVGPALGDGDVPGRFWGCMFKYRDGSGKPTSLIFAGNTLDGSETVPTSLPEHTRHVDGLGDRALFVPAPTPQNGNALYVFVRNRVLLVSGQSLTLRHARQVAEIIIGNW